MNRRNQDKTCNAKSGEFTERRLVEKRPMTPFLRPGFGLRLKGVGCIVSGRVNLPNSLKHLESFGLEWV